MHSLRRRPRLRFRSRPLARLRCVFQVGCQTATTMPGHPHGPYRLCPYCGSDLEDAEVAGATRRRCPSCRFVHFKNPGIGAAVVVRNDAGEILLVQRSANSTKPGLWCIPAGYVDDGEGIREAAVRELAEETGLIATAGRVLQVETNRHDPDRTTIGTWFEGLDVSGEPTPGDDAVAAGFFSFDALPEMAFETDIALIERLRSEDQRSASG